MGVFSFLKKSTSGSKFSTLPILDVIPLTKESVKLIFDTSKSDIDFNSFEPGQYVNIEVLINNQTHRRSYSICSSNSESLSIGVKRVEHGLVSNFLNDCKSGDVIKVFPPEGNFTSQNSLGKTVFIAAGSGITPIISIIKSNPSREFQLFFGNKSSESTMFKEELDQLKNVRIKNFYSESEDEHTIKGRITKDAFVNEIKQNLDLLKSDEFMICGPHEMILGVQEALKMFGVQASKIKFELFKVEKEDEVNTHTKTESYSGPIDLEVELDDEISTFKAIDVNKTILDIIESQGLDAPYSCRGGVCSSCKAKVLEGQTEMKLNYSLTDEEVKEGYILTCQSLCKSEKVKITYDA